jgi:hypothetical protein
MSTCRSAPGDEGIVARLRGLAEQFEGKFGEKGKKATRVDASSAFSIAPHAREWVEAGTNFDDYSSRVCRRG